MIEVVISIYGLHTVRFQTFEDGVSTADAGMVTGHHSVAAVVFRNYVGEHDALVVHPHPVPVTMVHHAILHPHD